MVLIDWTNKIKYTPIIYSGWRFCERTKWIKEEGGLKFKKLRGWILSLLGESAQKWNKNGGWWDAIDTEIPIPLHGFISVPFLKPFLEPAPESFVELPPDPRRNLVRDLLRSSLWDCSEVFIMAYVSLLGNDDCFKMELLGCIGVNMVVGWQR